MFVTKTGELVFRQIIWTHSYLNNQLRAHALTDRDNLFDILQKASWNTFPWDTICISIHSDPSDVYLLESSCNKTDVVQEKASCRPICSNENSVISECDIIFLMRIKWEVIYKQMILNEGLQYIYYHRKNINSCMAKSPTKCQGRLLISIWLQ